MLKKRADELVADVHERIIELSEGIGEYDAHQAIAYCKCEVARRYRELRDDDDPGMEE